MCLNFHFLFACLCVCCFVVLLFVVLLDSCIFGFFLMLFVRMFVFIVLLSCAFIDCLSVRLLDCCFVELLLCCSPVCSVGCLFFLLFAC